MARKMTEWPSKRGPITKIMPSDGCIGDTVPLAVGKRYDFHEFGWYMGNVGSIWSRYGHDGWDGPYFVAHYATPLDLRNFNRSMRRNASHANYARPRINS